jgi:hypothetical protein
LSVAERNAYRAACIELACKNRLYCSNKVCSKFLGSADGGKRSASCSACSTLTCSACKAPEVRLTALSFLLCTTNECFVLDSTPSPRRAPPTTTTTLQSSSRRNSTERGAIVARGSSFVREVARTCAFFRSLVCPQSLVLTFCVHSVCRCGANIQITVDGGRGGVRKDSLSR